MRKIIVAICGMFITIISFAAPGHYATPDGTSNFGDAWHFNENATYNVDIGTSFYSELSEQICKKEDCSVESGQGTYNDERAIVLDVAREIYKNGAKFCTTQIQGANANGWSYTWIDYYSNSNYDNKCRVYCKPGYDPESNCDKKLSGEICDDPDYGMFNEHKIINAGKGETGRFTKDMAVFSVDNETGSSDSNPKTAKHVVLGIIKKDESGNGVLVAPIQIIAKRAHNPIESWIYSASYQESLAAVTVLCPQGFQVDNSEKCVLTPKCKQEQQDAENDALPMCSGYGHYDAMQHTIKIQSTGGNKCKYYRCKESNYGFEKGSQHKCVPCGETKKSGVLHGECKVCATGELFDKNESNGCKTARKITKEKMRACFMKTDPDEFKTCVNN
ncbi:MAG: hypothetical protein IJL21_03405 [Alphaproteobacteria bacterium]|nr:hypothetical protein [Alphaproteobacteria bacterium]